MTRPSTLKDLEEKVEELNIAYEQSIIYAKELKGEIEERRKVESALAEERTRFERLIELSPDGVILVQDEKILLANHSFADIFRYSDAKKLVGKKVIELFEKKGRGSYSGVFHFKKGKQDIDALQHRICIKKENKETWISVSSKVIQWKSRPAILSNISDITHDVLREAALKEEAEYARKENIRLRSSIKERYRFGRLIGKSTPMQKVYEFILKAAVTDANVIIEGESGTGKELVANAIHDVSDRSKHAFTPVNCGAIPENLIESEFFGHRKGAFTGANRDKEGFLHAADRGTLFLDEVGEIGPNMQVKLLRALETGEYNPVGDTSVRKSDIRVIFATNKNPLEMVEKGLMREDFYYRISVIPIRLPPLRERKDDILLLVDHFLQLYAKEGKTQIIPAKMMTALYNYEWPGNVRELQSVIRRYLVLGDFPILEKDEIGKLEPGQDNETGEEFTSLAGAMEIQEKRFILKALNQNRWHKGKTATRLKVDPKTLYMKMKKYGIS